MGSQSTFSHLRWSEVEGGGVALSADDPARDKAIDEPGTCEGWAPIDLELREGVLVDYLPNDMGRLCSPRLRDVIDGHLGPGDDVQWLDARVTDARGRSHEYFVLRFCSHPDVLHAGRTIHSRGDFVVKAVLDASRVGGRVVFAFPGASIRAIVADQVRDAIVAAGCSGVEFSPVPMAWPS